MKYKLIALLSCALVISALPGCRLAKVNSDTSSREDELIGLFITTEYLELFDFDGYLNDNIGSFRGGEIIMDGGGREYQGKLYAALETETLTNEETGEVTEIQKYVFRDIPGIAFFSAIIPATDEHESYKRYISDDAISDGHVAYNYGDDEVGFTLEGTIFVTPKGGGETYYSNPVYQSADGGVYAVSGSGCTVSNEAFSEGGGFSQTIDATVTITENGKTKKSSAAVTFSVSVMFEPEKIVVLQMSADSAVLRRDEYPPGALPPTISPTSGAAYIIVETHNQDDLAKPKIARELYGPTDEQIETFHARDDGICVKQQTQIEWADKTPETPL